MGMMPPCWWWIALEKALTASGWQATATGNRLRPVEEVVGGRREKEERGGLSRWQAWARACRDERIAGMRISPGSPAPALARITRTKRLVAFTCFEAQRAEAAGVHVKTLFVLVSL
jgi:hypothetical protein